MTMSKNANEIVLFESSDAQVTLPVSVEGETVWLTRNQMAILFDRDVKTIGKHINNALAEELEGAGEATVAKFATVQIEGAREVERQVDHYNLDVIISVGYRVKSRRGVEFRRWATGVLREYIMKGHVENRRRLEQLGQIVNVMDRVPESLGASDILAVVKAYTGALDLLDDYDHQRVGKPQGNAKATHVLEYDECRELIESMRFAGESDLFGVEKDGSFKSSIAAIYQGFGGQELYPSLEEKAANLLYFVTKNHSFLDGNKRIAASLFLYFLDVNGALWVDGRKRVPDSVLVAVTIMIAESNPKEKEAMVALVMSFLSPQFA